MKALLEFITAGFCGLFPVYLFCFKSRISNHELDRFLQSILGSGANFKIRAIWGQFSNFFEVVNPEKGQIINKHH